MLYTIAGNHGPLVQVFSYVLSYMETLFGYNQVQN
ncbi:hypothetical protein BURK2_00195 [Burkholderiales bacterium]|nr:hypothetical protein BURK2_00195 [Burkholderiales bacterium]